MSTSAFGVERTISKSLVHVGAHAVGRGLGQGAKVAGKSRGAHKIYTPADKKPRGVRVASLRSTKVGDKVGFAAIAAVPVIEGTRRGANRKGANIKATEPYRHPLKSAHKVDAANYRHDAKKWQKTADKKPDSLAGPIANNQAYRSVKANAKAVGGRKAGKAVGKFDPTKKYSPPETIGKGVGAMIADSAVDASRGLRVGLKGSPTVPGLITGTPGTGSAKVGAKVGGMLKPIVSNPAATATGAAAGAGVATVSKSAFGVERTISKAAAATRIGRGLREVGGGLKDAAKANGKPAAAGAAGATAVLAAKDRKPKPRAYQRYSSGW